MTFAISLYELSVWVHVSAVVVGLGTTFIGAVSFPLAMRAGAQHLPYAHGSSSSSASGSPGRRSA